MAIKEIVVRDEDGSEQVFCPAPQVSEAPAVTEETTAPVEETPAAPETEAPAAPVEAAPVDSPAV